MATISNVCACWTAVAFTGRWEWFVVVLDVCLCVCICEYYNMYSLIFWCKRSAEVKLSWVLSKKGQIIVMVTQCGDTRGGHWTMSHTKWFQTILFNITRCSELLFCQQNSKHCSYNEALLMLIANEALLELVSALASWTVQTHYYRVWARTSVRRWDDSYRPNTHGQCLKYPHVLFVYYSNPTLERFQHVCVKEMDEAECDVFWRRAFCVLQYLKGHCATGDGPHTVLNATN